MQRWICPDLSVEDKRRLQERELREIDLKDIHLHLYRRNPNATVLTFHETILFDLSLFPEYHEIWLAVDQH
jgi:hypothetical protein